MMRSQQATCSDNGLVRPERKQGKCTDQTCTEREDRLCGNSKQGLYSFHACTGKRRRPIGVDYECLVYTLLCKNDSMNWGDGGALMKPLASSDTGKGALAGDRAARRKRPRFAVIAILSALPLSILAGEAWSESRLDILKLETSVRTLGRRVQALERLHRSVICGRMDLDLLKDSTSLYPLACQPDRDKPPLQVDLPRLRATLVRS